MDLKLKLISRLLVRRTGFIVFTHFGKISRSMKIAWAIYAQRQCEL